MRIRWLLRFLFHADTLAAGDVGSCFMLTPLLLATLRTLGDANRPQFEWILDEGKWCCGPSFCRTESVVQYGAWCALQKSLDENRFVLDCALVTMLMFTQNSVLTQASKIGCTRTHASVLCLWNNGNTGMLPRSFHTLHAGLPHDPATVEANTWMAQFFVNQARKSIYWFSPRICFEKSDAEKFFSHQCSLKRHPATFYSC